MKRSTQSANEADETLNGNGREDNARNDDRRRRAPYELVVSLPETVDFSQLSSESESFQLETLNQDERTSVSLFTSIRRFITARRSKAFAFSLLLHACLVFILASIFLTSRVGTLGINASGGFVPDLGELDTVDEIGDSTLAESSFEIAESEDLYELTSQTLEEQLVGQSLRSLTQELTSIDGNEATVQPESVGLEGNDQLGGFLQTSRIAGSASGRNERKRGMQGREGDVTKASEDAVERGLDWLARHQLPDGGWAFDLTDSDASGRPSVCRGCSNSVGTSGGGTYRQPLFPNRTAATALALLPYLGAGYTHVEANPYQKPVAAGLRFLEYAAVTKPDGVDFRAGYVGDGASYIQALATLVYCEAYEMTKDRKLHPLAKGGLDFIVHSQLNDGGWRYNSIGDPNFHATVAGDSSVLGWQIMALKSGASAGFGVPASVTYRASNFLDSVMDRDGRTYRYQPNTKEPVAKRWGTTAASVLSREYLGWAPGERSLDLGVKQLAEWIDASDAIWQKVKKGDRSGKVNNLSVRYFRDDRMIYNLYFAYYAALALHHYGGKLWSERFPKVRDLLVATQSRGGALGQSCESGSWLFYDQYMNDGGRLLNTSLAILILETPYRYLPMYRELE